MWKEPIKIEFNDGSEFVLPDVWSEAFESKFSGRIDPAKEHLAEEVEAHFDAQTKPDREDPELPVDWDEDIYQFKPGFLPDEYETHADLAPEVIFPYLREPIMSIALDRLRYGDPGERQF